MGAAIIISSITIIAGVSIVIKKFDEEGPEMFKKLINKKEEK
jgi:hypothetical protein